MTASACSLASARGGCSSGCLEVVFARLTAGGRNFPRLAAGAGGHAVWGWWCKCCFELLFEVLLTARAIIFPDGGKP